eukprot:SAG11_NODE_22557_length_403_cov_27.000000_1_plen_72_part_10
MIPDGTCFTANGKALVKSMGLLGNHGLKLRTPLVNCWIHMKNPSEHPGGGGVESVHPRPLDESKTGARKKSR